MTDAKRKDARKIGFRRRISLLALCAVVLSLIAAPVAYGAESDAKVVRVGYMQHENYQEGGPGEIKSGYGYEYLQKLRNYTGWTYEYVYVDSWGEQVAMLERGEIDLMLHAFRTPERMETMLFSVEPMGRESNYIYTRGDHPDLVAGEIDSLDGKTVGCMAGDFRRNIYTQWCQENGIGCTMEIYADLAAMHQDLAAGEIDAVIGSDFTSSPYSGDWVTILRLDEQSIYIAVRLGREDLLAEVNAAQSQILALNPGYPDEVRSKYQDVSSTHVPNLTQSQQAELAERGPLVVGYCTQHRPISYTDGETGELKGVTADYLNAMRSTYGISFETVAFDSDIALLEALSSGRVDIIVPVSYDYGMAEISRVSLTDSMTEEAMLALFKPYKGMDSKDLFKRIVVLENTITEKDYAKRHYPEAELVEAASVEEAASLVDSGRADCYVISSSVWSWYVREYPGVQELQVLNLPEPNEINMAVRTEDVALIPILNMGINLLSDSDVSHAIIAYSDVQEEITFLSLAMKNPVTTSLAVLAVILLVAVVFIWYRLRTESRYLGEMRAANERTEQARLEAERANRAKSTFLTSMSHDIRTPMNAIIGMTTLAGKRLHDPQYVRSCLNKVTLASDHLLTLVNDVLDINKIESGNLSLSPTVFSLADSIMNLSNIGRHHMTEKNHRFDIRIHNVKEEHLFADELRVNQIFINLLSNAVKYTEPGGRITVDVKQEPIPGHREKIRLIYIVEDNGIGMSPAFQEHMYELFTMANKGNGIVTGSGVGLAICKQLVDLMEGDIQCESAEGKGTKFTVTLELAVAERAVDHLVLPPMRLLLVDDDEIFLQTASDTLRELGLTPDSVNSGEKAVALVERKHREGRDYPLIIIDWQMPGMDGIETTRAIRAKVGPEVSIIVISAYGPEDIREAAMEAGANGFISKPFFASTARRSIGEILGLDMGETEGVDHRHRGIEGMHLLVAEDNDLNWEIVRELLKLQSVTAHRAPDGRECLRMLTSNPAGTYDAVLMDIQMPVMNGYDAARAIRGHERADLRAIPVIAMTADAYTEDILRCAAAGMDAHIPKPLELEKLLDTLRELRRK